LRSVEEASDTKDACEAKIVNTVLTVVPPDKILGETCDDVCKARMQEMCKSPGAAKAAAAAAFPYAETASWQARVIGGLGDFLAQRTKAEVMAWVEDLVSKRLCELTYRDLALPEAERKNRRWFASTCAILESPDYGMQKTTGMLAAAMRTDLLGLPQAAGYYALDRYKPKSADSKSGALKSGEPALDTERILADLQAALKLIAGLRRGAAPLELVAGLGDSPELRAQCKLHSPTDRVAPECGPVIGGLLVQYLGALITPTNVANRNPGSLDGVLAHVFGSNKLCAAITSVFDDKAQGCDPTKVPVPIARYLHLLTLAQDQYAKYRPRIERIARAMVILEAKVEAIKKTEPTVTNLTDLDLAFQELIDSGFGLFDELADQAGQFDTVMTLSRELLGLVGDFQTANYMAAGQRAIRLIAEVETGLGVKIPAKLKRFLAFTMDLASAKSSEDVSKAIEAVAAPIGGWKGKQEYLSVSVTGMVGGLGGYELPRTGELTMSPARTPGGGLAAGLFAPVGIDFAAPLCRHVESVGLFLSVIDVGQLTWARLGNVSDHASDIKADPTPVTDFGQVLSPGAYLHASIGHSPLVIGGGISYAPALRKYTLGTGAASMPEVEQLSTIRLGVFVAVDVTILPLWAGGGR